MEEGTINGRPIDEVFQSLKKDIPNVIRRTEEKNQAYLDKFALRSFFEEKIPEKNYDFEVSDVVLYSLEPSACFVCTGHLTVYDDLGKKVVKKSYTGSCNCQRNKDGKIVDMGMCARNAAGNALKNCITMFGCGIDQLQEAKGKKPERQSNRSYFSGNRNDSSHGTTGTCSYGAGAGSDIASRNMPKIGQGNFLLQCNGEVNDMPRMIIAPVICVDYQNFKTQLLIWKNNRQDINSLVNRIGSGLQFTCSGKFETYGNAYRIVFKEMTGGV